MNGTKNLCHAHRVALIAATAWLMCLTPALALAQTRADDEQPPGLAENETTVWLLEASTLGASVTEQVRVGLAGSLDGERGQHVIGDEAFAEYVRGRKPAAPTCLYGVGACVSAESLAFDALDVGLVIHVKIRKVGGSYEGAYRIMDRRGKPPGDRVVSAGSARDLGVALVREIYDATGLVSFTTNPPGAKVIVDGALVGQTPLEYRLPIGRHSYALQLESFQAQEGSVEVSAKEPAQVSAELAYLPGILVLEEIPPGALIFIDGREEPLNASQPVELAPGEYTYEVRAEGYSTIADTVSIEPGLSVRRPVAMVRLNPLLRDISPELIVYNRYILRVGFEQTLQRTSFRGARASGASDGELIVRQFIASEGETTSDPRRFFATRGIRLDAEYYWHYFGLNLLSISYLTDRRRAYDILVEDIDLNRENVYEMVQLDRLQLRPFQVSARYLYRNLVPSIQLGLGMNFQWLTLRDPNSPQADGSAFSLRQTEAFWSMDLGLQYYLTPNWFVGARYNFHDHFNLGVGTEHGFGINVGGALPNLFGFEPQPPEQL